MNTTYGYAWPAPQARAQHSRLAQKGIAPCRSNIAKVKPAAYRHHRACRAARPRPKDGTLNAERWSWALRRQQISRPSRRKPVRCWRCSSPPATRPLRPTSSSRPGYSSTSSARRCADAPTCSPTWTARSCACGPTSPCRRAGSICSGTPTPTGSLLQLQRAGLPLSTGERRCSAPARIPSGRHRSFRRQGRGGSRCAHAGPGAARAAAGGSAGLEAAHRRRGAVRRAVARGRHSRALAAPLRHQFLRPEAFRAELKRLSTNPARSAAAFPRALIEALDPERPGKAELLVTEHLEQGGIELIGMRTAAEIAEGLLAIAADAKAPPLKPETAALIEAYVKTKAAAPQATAVLRKLVGNAKRRIQRGARRLRAARHAARRERRRHGRCGFLRRVRPQRRLLHGLRVRSGWSMCSARPALLVVAAATTAC